MVRRLRQFLTIQKWWLVCLGLAYGVHGLAKDNPLCVSTKDGVVHITSGSKTGVGTDGCKTPDENVSTAREQAKGGPPPIETPLLNDSDPVRKFAMADKPGLLRQTESSVLSGPAGAALEVWMRLNERASGDTSKAFVVLQYGDSHSQGGTLPDQVRRRLAHAPISPGLINVNFPMNWSASVSKSKHWQRRNWLRDRDGPFGPLGIVFDSTRPGDTLTIQLPASDVADQATTITVLYDRRRASSAFTLSDGEHVLATLVDGVLKPFEDSTGNHVVDEESGLGRLSLSMPAGTSRLLLESGSTTSISDPLSIYGFVVQYPDASLEWDNLGVSGTEVAHLVKHGDPSVESYIKWRSPDLFVLWFGTNSLNDPTLTEVGYRRLFRTYLDRIAGAAPNTACLVIGPPDFMKRPRNCFMSGRERKALKGRRALWKRRLLSKKRRARVCEPESLVNHRKKGRYRFPVPGVRTMRDWQSHSVQCAYRTVPLMNEVVAIQKEVAHEAGCLFFDTLQFMGGPGSMHDWACMKPAGQASLDHIHLNTRGYRKVGDGIVDEINRALERLAP